MGRAPSIQTRCPESMPTVSMETLGKLDPRAPVCFGGQGHSQTSGGDGDDADDLYAKPEREHWTGVEAAAASGQEKRPPGGNRDVSILQKVNRPHARDHSTWQKVSLGFRGRGQLGMWAQRAPGREGAAWGRGHVGLSRAWCLPSSRDRGRKGLASAGSRREVPGPVATG